MRTTDLQTPHPPGVTAGATGTGKASVWWRQFAAGVEPPDAYTFDPLGGRTTRRRHRLGSGLARLAAAGRGRGLRGWGR